MEQQDHTHFSATYFDKDGVMRLEFWLRVIAWVVLVAYFFEAGYNLFQTIYNAMINGYPPDLFFALINFSRVFQGALLFGLLYAVAKGLLILLDIEDNTRRAARKS